MAHWEKEKLVVDNTPTPITKSQLVQDLKDIGVQPGDIISVHSSMKKMGWVVGEQLTVIEALMEAVTEDGSIVMQAHTTGNSDPMNWKYPSVPEEWWETIRKEMPPFRPDITPLRNLGRIPELFRIMPGVLRSDHPQVSCTAWGKYTKSIVKEHELADPYGERSPWGVLYRLKSKILLIGVDHESNTALHYAEKRASTPDSPRQITGAAIIQNGERRWLTWEDIRYNPDDFNELGLAFERSIEYKTMTVGQAESRLLSMRELIDFATDWIRENR